MSDLPAPKPPPEWQVVYPVGVRHIASGVVVKPDGPLWSEYQAYLARGGELAPADASPPLSPDEVLARLEITSRRDLIESLRADGALQALRTRTPAQIDAWIDGNVTNLAQAREVLKLLARVVALIARERLA